jgi:TonB family protein
MFRTFVKDNGTFSMPIFKNSIIRFELWLDNLSEQVYLFLSRHKVGILGSIALNMIAIILLLSFEMSSRKHLYETIVLVDFDREYEILPEQEEEVRDPILPKDAIVPEYEYEAIRNIAVDATKEDLNPGLIDEKNINADELYQEAQRIREQMQRNKELWEETRGDEALNIPNVDDKTIVPQDEGQFKGPTVISYFLEGRKALHLPVPAYKCEFGGRVVVDIEVSINGTVAKATIDTANSVIDECMNNAALEAARNSLFTVSPQAINRQKGSITYLFVRQ